MSDNIAITKIDIAPEGLQDSCREAADSCAVDAIILDE
jgi:ferredoxin